MCERTAVWRIESGPEVNSCSSSWAISYSLELEDKRGYGEFFCGMVGILWCFEVVCCVWCLGSWEVGKLGSWEVGKLGGLRG